MSSLSSQSQTSSKGKGRADENNDAFQPEQPRRGPQVGSNSRQAQDDAKRRLVRNTSQQPSSSKASTPTVTGEEEQQRGGQGQQDRAPSSSSSHTVRSPTQEAPSPAAASSVTMQALGSTAGSATAFSQQQHQILHRPQRVRIREDVTKSTSFDRARDGDELYNLWVGPP